LGLGQIYAGKLWRGVLFFICPLLFGILACFYIVRPTTRLPEFSWVILFGFLVFQLFVFIDSYLSAQKYNTQHNLQREISLEKKILLIISIIIFGFLINPVGILTEKFVMYVRENIVQAFKIPADSMAPTLITGDRILVDKSIYKKSLPKRGDIIVFQYPEDPKRDFVKRIVGLPNETIEISNGRILVNGVVLSAEPFLNIFYDNRGDYGKIAQRVTVLPDSYFVLGDI
jgi:signal peptidase I